MADLLEDRRKYAAVEWQTPAWEWVDPQNEQAASQASIDAFQSTLQEELGSRGRNWRYVLYQRAKEEELKRKLGLVSQDVAIEQASVAADGGTAPSVQSLALNGAQVTSLVEIVTQVGTGALPKETAKAILAAAFPDFAGELIDSIVDPIEPGSVQSDGVASAAIQETEALTTGSSEMMGLSRLQWKRNRKAIDDLLNELIAGTMSAAKAEVMLSGLGLNPESIAALIADSSDGSIETQLPTGEEAEVASV